MKSRPILFSAPMVRALLDGSKTQTRRIVKPQPVPNNGQPEHLEFIGSGGFRAHMWEPWSLGHPRPGYEHVAHCCPYGQPGDRLWVRETTIDVEEHGYVGPVFVESDEGRATLDGGLGQPDDFAEVEPYQLKKRPSIFMPRSMSRITLEIVSVRVERLQDISEADAKAEGLFRFEYGGQVSWRDYSLSDEWAAVSPMLENPIDSYRTLWESINNPGSWAANPWVWVVEFKRLS